MAELSAERIVLGYSDTFLAIRRRLRTYATVAWGNLDDYRDAEILRFARAMDRAVTASQLQVARLTDQYLATIASLITGASVHPVGIPPSLVNDLAIRGVPAVDVYARTGPEVWSALSNGVPPTEAFSMGLDRAVSMASTDLQLAKTHTSREVVDNDPRIIGYARVPEGASPCELCETASTNRYTTENLMPIHNNCSCDVVPIYGEKFIAGRAGQNIDARGLRDQGRLGESQLRGDPVVHEHGELGPVLAVAGDDFRGPDDL